MTFKKGKRRKDNAVIHGMSDLRGRETGCQHVYVHTVSTATPGFGERKYGM